MRQFANPAVVLGLALMLVSCDATLAPYRETDHDRVGAGMRDLEQGLRSQNWSRVERFFSAETYGGSGEIRNRIEDGWRNQRLLQLQFIVNRVLERDGLLNAQVRWNKSWVDAAGKPQKKSGVSEFILRPQGESFHILSVAGDALF